MESLKDKIVLSRGGVAVLVDEKGRVVLDLSRIVPHLKPQSENFSIFINKLICTVKTLSLVPGG